MSPILRAPATVSVDGYQLAGLGFTAERFENVRSTADLAWPAVRVAGLDGLLLSDTLPQVVGREFSVVGVMGADTAAALRANYRELVARCDGSSGRTVALVDDTSREVVALFQGATFEYLRRFGWDAARVTLRWLALSPYWRDTTDTVVTLSNADTPLPLGNAPCFGVVVVTGAATTPVLTYKNSAGTTLHTLTLATIAGGDSVTLDMATRTLTHSVSGVTPSLRTAGRYFVCSPADGVYASSSWPTLRLSSGTGTITYRRAWRG